MEQWKKIEGFENYSVSNNGQVRNDKTGRILKTYKKPSGYIQVQMGRKTVPKYIHRLVAQAFIPNASNKPQINHKNGNKGDNRADNLEWVTASENAFAYGYDIRIEHKKKRVIATNVNGKTIVFNSRDEAAKYFQCNKANIDYGRVYKKGNKKGWIFELS